MDIEDMSLESLKNYVKRLEDKQKVKPFPELTLIEDEDNNYFGFKIGESSVMLIDDTSEEINSCIRGGFSIAEFYSYKLPEGFKFVAETDEEDCIKIFLRRG